MLQADVLVIGGGITGLSVAASLKESDPELDVWVLERSVLPYGASTRNAGFACFGSLTETLSDMDSMGQDAARELLFQRWMGLKITRKRLGDERIGFEETGGFEHLSKERLVDLGRLDEVNTLVNDFIADYITHVPEQYEAFGFNVEGTLVQMKEEGQVDTGAMMDALERYVTELGVRVRTGAEVVSVEGGIVHVQDAQRGTLELRAQHVVNCTNAFATQISSELNIVPGRGQVLITHPIENLRFRGNLHYDEGFYYLRNVQDRLLFGGGRNRFAEQENTDEFETSADVQAHLDDQLKRLFGSSMDWTVDMRWSGIMAFGSEKRPIIEQDEQGVIHAVRLSGMGIALAGFIGEEVATMIADQH